MTEPREALAALLEQAMQGGYVAELPLDMIADRLLDAGVHLGDEGLRTPFPESLLRRWENGTDLATEFPPDTTESMALAHIARWVRQDRRVLAHSEGPGLDALRAVIAAVEAACPVCGGDGWTMDHDPADETGQTPMQVPCWDAEHSVILRAALAAQENPT